MSKYFSIKELTYSNTAVKYGIDNTPTKKILDNLNVLALFLDKVREMWGKPLIVNSGYRSPELNKKVGGVHNSNHLKGEAVDITTGNKSDNIKLFNMIKNSSLDFDELIDEKKGSWVHLAYRKVGNRRKVLSL